MISDQQTLIAVLVAALAVATAVFVTTKIRGKDLLGQVREAFGYAFEPQRRRPFLLLLVSIGLPLTVFYLVALPADQSGTVSWDALQFLTAGDVLGAVLLGFGTATTIALNIGVRKSRGTNTTLTVTGNVAAIVPTLFCTSLLPSGLVLVGASAPVIVQRCWCESLMKVAKR